MPMREKKEGWLDYKTNSKESLTKLLGNFKSKISIRSVPRISACPPPGDLPNPGIEHASPALAGRFFSIESPREPYCDTYMCPSGPWSWLPLCFWTWSPLPEFSSSRLHHHLHSCLWFWMWVRFFFFQKVLLDSSDSMWGLLASTPSILCVCFHLSIYLSISCLCSLVLNPLWKLLTF